MAMWRLVILAPLILMLSSVILTVLLPIAILILKETGMQGSNVPGFRTKKAPMIIRLLSGSGTPAQGIYHCLIEVQSDYGMFQNVYVGLYHSGEGMPQSSCVYTPSTVILL